MLGAATGPLWGWGARSKSQEHTISFGNLSPTGPPPITGHECQPVCPEFRVPLSRGAHQLHVAEAGLGREGMMNNDPSGQAKPRGQQRVSHHQHPKHSFITFSPFPPTPPSPASTCGAERSCWSTWGWTSALGQGEEGGRTYSSSWGSRKSLKEGQEKQIRDSPGEGTAGSRVGATHGLTGSPRSPLLPGAPGLPCRKDGWNQRGREWESCGVWVQWDLGYPAVRVGIGQ